PFTFRFWVNDVTAPSIRLLSSRIRHGQPLQLALADAGSGVDPGSLRTAIDGHDRTPHLGADGSLTVPGDLLRPGRHSLVVSVADYQEAKNMEDVPPILPNTRVLRTTITVVP